jgi:hypothetical protein
MPGIEEPRYSWGRNYQNWFTENQQTGDRYNYLYSLDELEPWVEPNGPRVLSAHKKRQTGQIFSSAAPVHTQESRELPFDSAQPRRLRCQETGPGSRAALRPRGV